MASQSSNPEYPSWLAADERKAVRIPVDWPATVAADKFGVEAVRITNCTRLGCRIETWLAVTVGTFVHVAVPNFADVPGWVAWSSPEAIGVDFAHPLPNRVLEYIIEQNVAI
ncbi:PilZ domain-containing protein [Sphingomonas sp. LB3N6]|uniref:PilZ domain-containing protein n=1 Tax=Sphingomonas fucosidasi TaxID=3096164 RepID=UPI003FA6A7A8